MADNAAALAGPLLVVKDTHLLKAAEHCSAFSAQWRAAMCCLLRGREEAGAGDGGEEAVGPSAADGDAGGPPAPSPPSCARRIVRLRGVSAAGWRRITSVPSSGLYSASATLEGRR
jgi:hypothetical protein